MSRSAMVWVMGIMSVASVAGTVAQTPAPDIRFFERVEPTPAGAAPENVSIEAEQEVVLSGPGEALMFDFVSAEFESGGVKGAPYSAEAVSESVQTLADGNRIVRKTVAQVYRDGEGRTRREQTATPAGPAAERQSILISDPGKGVSYIMDPEKRVARKLQSRGYRFGDSQEGGVVSLAPFEARAKVVITEGKRGTEVSAAVGDRTVIAPREFRIDASRVAMESLGTDTIGGVQVEGKRTTMTIPAGEIGNEQPIHVVTERWFSTELKLVVLSRRTDPRYGESTYRLNNITRAEPASSLFEVPPDYKVTEPAPPRILEMKKRKP